MTRSQHGQKWIAILMAIVAGPLLIWHGAREFQQGRRLAREGKTVMGRVVEHAFEFGPKRRERHYLVVAFRVEDGRAFTNRFRIPKTLLENAPVNAPIRVRYLPSAPEVCALGSRAEPQ